MKKRNLMLCVMLMMVGIMTLQAQNKEYYGSYFGIRSDGETVNTGSLQYAVDFISEQGGGTLILWVGRYLTGSVELKSNVTIQLQEGAILVGLPSPYDYKGKNAKAILWADGKENISVTGMGVIEGSGTTVQQNTAVQMSKGYLSGTQETNQVSLIAFSNCKNVKVDGITLRNSFGDVQVYDKCTNVNLNKLTVVTNVAKGFSGIKLSGSNNVTCSNSYFDVTGSPVLSSGGSKNVKVTKCITAEGNKNVVRTIN